MKLFFICTSHIVLSVLSRCSLFVNGTGTDDECEFLEGAVRLVDVQGTISTLDTGEEVLYLFTPDCNPDVQLALTGPYLEADNLPDAFMREGSRVVLSGTPVPVPPHIRLAASPLKLTSICPSE